MKTNNSVLIVGCDALFAVGDVVEIIAACITKGKRATVVEHYFGKIEVSFSPQWCGWYSHEQLRKISSVNTESSRAETNL